MALDEATRRFAFLLQRDLRRLAERREDLAAHGAKLTFDSVTRAVHVEGAHGEGGPRLFGEVLATYAPRDRILRWAWAGRAPSASLTHGDLVFREGQARGVAQLAMSVVGDLDPDEAATLVHLGALVARADSVHDRATETETEFIGLFDRPNPSEGSRAEPPAASRFSVPPPPVHQERPREDKHPPPRAYRSIPPIREIYEPRTGGSRPPPELTPWSNLSGASAASPSRPPPARAPSPSTAPAAASPSVAPGASASAAPGASASAAPGASASAALGGAKRGLREPSRELFLPVANTALAALTRASKGYLQGLFVLTLDGDSRSAERRGLVVQLVVIDAAGILRALDPPSDVLEAAAHMVDADLREGNGHWRKLSARITPKPDGGATLNVDVV